MNPDAIYDEWEDYVKKLKAERDAKRKRETVEVSPPPLAFWSVAGLALSTAFRDFSRQVGEKPCAKPGDCGIIDGAKLTERNGDED